MKARAYAGADRDEWQQPERVVASLGLEPGQKVADLGAGGGYFSFRLADAVGPSGKVYAVDIDEAMNERLQRLAAERGASNVEVVLALSDDLRLPEPVDVIFTSNTYHHLEDRSAYFDSAARYLTPGGRVAIVEYKEEGFLQRVMGHSTGAESIRAEMKAAGYALDVEHDFLAKQHFLIFSRLK
jgi:predicted methyltransferase